MVSLLPIQNLTGNIKEDIKEIYLHENKLSERFVLFEYDIPSLCDFFSFWEKLNWPMMFSITCEVNVKLDPDFVCIYKNMAVNG